MTKELQESKPGNIEEMPEFQPMDEADSIRLPRLSLVQGKRQEIKDGLAKDGDLINSLSKENYGREIELVPLAQQKSARIRWRPREEGGGMLCIARDGEHGAGDPGDTLEGNACRSCPYHRDYSNKTGCTSNYQIVALVRHTREPIILTADSIKPADQGIRDLLGMARQNAVKGLRLYQKSYILKVVEAKNKQYEFYKLTCVPGNNNKPLDDEEVVSLAQQSGFYRGSKIATDHEEQEEASKDW